MGGSGVCSPFTGAFHISLINSCTVEVFTHAKSNEDSRIVSFVVVIKYLSFFVVIIRRVRPIRRLRRRLSSVVSRRHRSGPRRRFRRHRPPWKIPPSLRIRCRLSCGRRNSLIIAFAVFSSS